LSGDPLTVAAPLSIGSGGSLTLSSGGALVINAPVTVAGAGSVNLAAANDTTTVAGASLLELSFAQGASLQFTGTPNSGQALAINGQAYTLVYSMAQLDAIDGSSAVNGANVTAYGAGLSGRYALAGNLDATGILYTDALVGTYATQSSATAFTGTFEGLGHTITGLTIAKAGDYAGLFGAIGSGATVRDVGLVGGSVSGQLDVGGLAGASIEGTIVQSYASGAVSASQDYAGGLVGHNFYATIIRSYATGSVTGYVAGGLVGENFSLSTIIESYATGAVTGGLVGGLVGDNYGGTISRSYATGPVTGSDAGGLVTINSGVTTDSYWDTQTSGQPSSAGGTGLTTAQLQNGAATGLGAAFSGGTGGLYPYLTNFFPNGVQAVSGTALTSGGTATSGAQLGVYSGGTLLTGVTTSAGANGYFYEIVAAGTLAGNAKFGAMLTLAGAGSVSGLLFTDAATSSGSVFALGRLNDGLNRQITADTTYSALQTDLGATFGTTRYATLATTLNATPTSITATAASFTLDQAVKVAADFSLSTTGTNAPLTLNANLSAARQTVTLTSTGSIGQNGGTITADTLTGSSVGDAFFTEAGNNIGALGTFSTTGGFALIDAASLSVSGAVKAAGTALISTTSGNLDITTGSVTSSAIGDAVTLATSGDFTNGVGASAVQAANGRWLIYSANPAGDTFAGLDSGNTAIWGTAAGATVSASGNRYVFALTPTLTVTSTNDSKVYGTDDGAAIAADYTVLGVQSGVTGAYLGDTAATAYSGAATVSSAGSAANSHVVAGGYAYTLGLVRLPRLRATALPWRIPASSR
jgi:hypothetical protein